jgi:hypothetical protein
MNSEILTTKSREVLTSAIRSATDRGHASVEPAHLLLALLDTEARARLTGVPAILWVGLFGVVALGSFAAGCYLLAAPLLKA